LFLTICHGLAAVSLVSICFWCFGQTTTTRLYTMAIPMVSTVISPRTPALPLLFRVFIFFPKTFDDLLERRSAKFVGINSSVLFEFLHPRTDLFPGVRSTNGRL
jgi:hypothetical protein